MGPFGFSFVWPSVAGFFLPGSLRHTERPGTFTLDIATTHPEQAQLKTNSALSHRTCSDYP
jgi:hypothetical protein